MPREPNTRSDRLRAAALAALLAATAAAAPLPRAGPAAARAPARAVLAPSFFPTWQARNVAFPFVLRVAGAYRMYYAGSGAAQFNDSVADQWSTGLATSPDGWHWTAPDDYEPVLRGTRFADGDVVEPARRARFDALSAFGVSVVEAAPAGPARYFMYYTGWNGDDEPEGEGRARPVHFRIGLATSPDGRQWTKREGTAGLGAVLGYDPGVAAESRAVGQPFVRREGAGYRMWYEAFDGVTWRIAGARSKDGLSWTREGVVLEPGGADAPDALGARDPVVLQRRGRFELWYQGKGGAPPAVRVLRALSDDGRRWIKATGAVDLRLPAPLEGGEALHADSVLVEPDGACRVFFAREETRRRRTALGEALSRGFRVFSVRVDP